MGMMARMRSLTPVFILTVGGLFVLFMVLSDSKVMDIVGQRTNNVGSVNGEEISYQDFMNYVDQARQNQVQQTGKDVDESQMDRFRDQVWNAVVNQTLIDQKINDFGINVTDQELKEKILGDNPPDFLKQNFMDSTGQFDREQYETALRDPRNKEILVQIEKQVRQQLIQDKLQNYLFASVLVTNDEVKEQFINQNIKMKAKYAFVSESTIDDSLIIVSDSDIQKYYDEHADDYKIDAQRKIKYVLFRKEATAGDSSGIEKNLEAIVDKIKGDTTSFKDYVDIYSDNPYSKDTLTISELPEAARNPLLNADRNELVGPVPSANGYVVYKVDQIMRSNETFVNAQHILIRTGQEPAKAKAKADSLYNVLANGADFASVAAASSEDRASARNGGDLGWFGKGQMVEEFEEKAYNAPIGVVQRPIKSTFGYHIIKVNGRTNKKFVVESISNKVIPSATTLDNIYNNANDFAYLADKNGFESEANIMEYNISESPAFKEDAQVIPGLGANQALVNFAFDNDVGDISTVFKVQAGYVVAQVSEIIKPGVKSLDEVKSQVRRKLLQERKLEKSYEIASTIYDAVGPDGSLETAQNVYPQARVDTTPEFTVSGSIPGIGRDYAFAEYSLSGELNKVSAPVKGSAGSYLIKVLERTPFDSTAFASQKLQIRDNLVNSKKSLMFVQWIQNLREDADIVDNRYQFFR